MSHQQFRQNLLADLDDFSVEKKSTIIINRSGTTLRWELTYYYIVSAAYRRIALHVLIVKIW